MISRLLKYSVKNTLRNTFLTVSSILVITLLMFFINILSILKTASEEDAQNLNSKMSFALYLKNEYDEKSLGVKDLISDIKKTEPQVQVKYFSREETLENMGKKDEKLISIIEGINDLEELESENLIPKTIIISGIQIGDYEKINTIIEGKMFLFDIDSSKKKGFANYASQYERIKSNIDKLKQRQNGILAMIIIFIVAIGVINYSVISNFIYYYKDEIYITKLVGGANIFIYGPFVLQGILYAFISFLLNIIILFIGLKNVEMFFSDFSLPHISNTTLLLELVVFLLIGAISGYFSSKKYLKKNI